MIKHLSYLFLPRRALASLVGAAFALAVFAAPARAQYVQALTTVGDANYSMINTDRTVATSAALTAARTWTLPAANSYLPGKEIVIVDLARGVSGTNTLTIARAGSDTITIPASIGGSTTSILLNTAGGSLILRSDGVSQWGLIGALGSNGLLTGNQTWTGVNTFSGNVNFTGSTFQRNGFTQTFPGFNATLPAVIASGAKALATSAISSGACSAAQTATATGTLTTDTITVAFNADPTGVTGYVPATSGMLTIIYYPTADTVNFKVCNNTASSITPGAVTINYRVIR